MTSNNRSKVSSSSASLYQECPYAWYWQYELNLEPKAFIGLNAMTFGNAIHKALAQYALNLGRPNAENVAMETLERETTFLKSMSPAWEEKKESLYTVDTGKTALRKVWQSGLFDNMEVLSVEEKHTKQLTDNYDYHGFTDLILKDKETGQVIVVDHKTTGFWSNTSINKYRASKQFMSYCWLAGTCNFKVNVIHITKDSIDVVLLDYIYQQEHIDICMEDIKRTVCLIENSKRTGQYIRTNICQYKKCDYMAVCLQYLEPGTEKYSPYVTEKMEERKPHANNPTNGIVSTIF